MLRIDYAAGATISRVNKGLRRRKQKSILGFGIDPATGRWTTNVLDDDQEQPPDVPIRQRVVPIVQDNKNAALIRLTGEPLSETAMTTLQHALARGLELVFQLEEGETLTEPVPSREGRKAVLAFEATEGGAGVLGQLTSDPGALASVARAALELMHYREIDKAIEAADPALLVSDPEAACVKGCYRCLLSYYNQPDQELIDRTDAEVLEVLLRLARSQVASAAPIDAKSDDWARAFARWGLPAPKGAPLKVGGAVLPMVWPEHRVAAGIGVIPDAIREGGDALGFTVLAFPERPGDTPPPELVELLGGAS
jgi:hypothetical protein